MLLTGENNQPIEPTVVRALGDGNYETVKGVLEKFENRIIKYDKRSRAYFPHYFSRPSPEFHRELDNIWQQGVLKGEYPTTPAKVKKISRMNGTKRVVAAPRGHAKSTSLTFKGSIHAIVYEYKHYPIIISDSSEQAEGFLDNIRVEFEENEALKEDLTWIRE